MWTMVVKMLFGAAGPLLRAIWAALQDQHVFELALAAAQAEVRRLEGDTSMDGDAKRKAAEKAVLAALVQAGRELEPQLVDLAIQIALAALRAAAPQAKRSR